MCLSRTVSLMRLSIMLGLLLTVYNLIFAGGAVIKRQKSVAASAALSHHNNNEHIFDKHDNERNDNDEDFSPYFAAFNDRLRRELDVHEKLRDQLKHFHELDWDDIAEVKAFESEDSDD